MTPERLKEIREALRLGGESCAPTVKMLSDAVEEIGEIESLLAKCQEALRRANEDLFAARQAALSEGVRAGEIEPLLAECREALRGLMGLCETYYENFLGDDDESFGQLPQVVRARKALGDT